MRPWAAWWAPAARAPTAKTEKSSTAISFPVFTYNGSDKHLGGVTYGGYSHSIVVDEAFGLSISTKSQSRRRRTSALRGHHDVFADAPLEGRKRGRRSGSWDSAASVTWG